MNFITEDRKCRTFYRATAIYSQAERLASYVRMEGLEPPRLSAPDPKSGAATNYATCANVNKNEAL